MENPREARHTFDLSRGKCVHWFLSSIGWQWNLGTEQLRGFSCESEALEELHQLPSQGADFDLWILYAFGACHLRGCFPASLPPAWKGASPTPPSSDSSVWAAERLAVLTEGPSTLEFASPLV